MSLLIKFLAGYNRRGLRGSYRLTTILSDRLKSLQNLPIHTEDGDIFTDLRISSSRGILANPQSLTGEDLVMKRFVRQGDIVFDVGAHFGFYTLLLSNLVGKSGRVFAFEPNPELLTCLKQTIKQKSNIELVQMALSDRAGNVSLFVPEDASMASMSDWTNGVAGDVHTVQCEMVKMDDMVSEGKLPVPQFIKCDVEGAELKVFSGGLKTLNREDAPILLFEVNANAAKGFDLGVNELFNMLESLELPRYRFFEVLPDGINELTDREIVFANVAAIPEARNEQEST